ncbi:hypothetical protein [Paracoccus mutanolyticus]|nr:hypothetical protein [Paracoccus mutanolyticus]
MPCWAGRGRAGRAVYPESLIGFLGRSVEVRPIIHPQFRISSA